MRIPALIALSAALVGATPPRKVSAAALALGLALIAATPAISKPITDPRIAAGATPEAVAAAMSVKDDPMETVIRITSEPFYQPLEKGFLGAKVLTEDSYLEARVDRATGKTTYDLVYWGKHLRDWYMWRHANIETPAGVVEVKGYDAGSDVSCARYGCNFTEAVAIPVSEEVLRWAASQPQGTPWAFRVKGRYTDSDRDRSILSNEIAGFLIAVDRAKGGGSTPGKSLRDPLFPVPEPTPQIRE